MSIYLKHSGQLIIIHLDHRKACVLLTKPELSVKIPETIGVVEPVSEEVFTAILSSLKNLVSEKFMKLERISAFNFFC